MYHTFLLNDSGLLEDLGELKMLAFTVYIHVDILSHSINVLSFI